VIDQGALVAALRGRRLAGAGLDVFVPDTVNPQVYEVHKEERRV
jgi:phosphoglycerate dehydrogenase-like enzyme